MMYLLICKLTYPIRCASCFLQEFQPAVSFAAIVFIFVGTQLTIDVLQFNAKFEERALEAKTDRSLDRTCSSLMMKFCQKYDNLAEVDKLAAVTKRIESVKLVLEEEFIQSIHDCVKLECIERAAGKC